VLTRLPIPLVPFGRHSRTWICCVLAVCLLALGSGCSRFHQEKHDTVYLWARQMYLHDRVAAVSNRVAAVVNGQQLEVLEHGRRFLKVRTEKNEIGWIEERAVIDSTIYDAFVQLAKQNKDDPVVATGTVRDDVYLHLKPGRETDRFYLLPANAKVQLLVRASVPKTPLIVPQSRPTAQAPIKSSPASGSQRPAAPRSAEAVPSEPEAPPVVMEDWWLVRDGQGRAGWLLSGRVDVDVPDEIAQYAEGQRIVGAYVIAKVSDAEAATPDHRVPEYVTALGPPKSGLPFDFDQIRVFTWSVKRHRYETAYRLHPIQGYLPLRITSQPGPGGTEPVFSFQIADSQNLTVDPDTGIARPLAPRTVSFAMRDTQVRRTGSDLGPIPITHAPGEKSKPGQAEKKKRK